MNAEGKTMVPKRNVLAVASLIMVSIPFSVTAIPLESTNGTSVGLKPRADGSPIFPTLPDRKLEVLNAAR